MQWQEAVKVLVKPLKQKSSWKDLGTPRSLQSFSLSRGSTVGAPCENNSIFAFSITVVLSSFIVKSVSSFRHETDFKTKLAKKCQVNVYTKSMGDIPLNENSVLP